MIRKQYVDAGKTVGVMARLWLLGGVALAGGEVSRQELEALKLRVTQQEEVIQAQRSVIDTQVAEITEQGLNTLKWQTT